VDCEERTDGDDMGWFIRKGVLMSPADYNRRIEIKEALLGHLKGNG